MAMEFNSRSSSPDPLALSYDENSNSPTKSGRRLSAVPLARSSANLLVPTTPTKPRRSPEINSARSVRSITMHTPGPDGLSPVRIRVTVETEPDQQPNTRNSKDSEQTQNMRIIHVPLKGADESMPVKRKGRSSLSTQALIELNRKDLTPMKGGRSEDNFRALLKKTSPSHLSNDPYGGFGVPSPVRPLTTKVSVNDKLGNPERRFSAKRRASDTPLPDDIPLRKKPSLEEDEDFEASFHYSPVLPKRKLGTRGEYLRQPLPSSPQSSSEDEYDDEGDAIFVNDTGNTESKRESTSTTGGNHQENLGMEDDTSVLDRSALESEGFSLVSIDSLRNNQAVSGIINSVELNQGQDGVDPASTLSHDFGRSCNVQSPQDMRNPYFRPPKRLSALENGPQNSQDSNSTWTVDKKLTPPVMSPLRSPPQMIQTSPVKSSPTKTSPAVRAGSELQNALSSVGKFRERKELGNLARPQHQTPVTEASNVFDGFGEGTRKQLKAGMMMGELLARGERGFISSVAASENPTDRGAIKTPLNTNGRASRQSRLLTPTDSEHSTESVDGSKTDPSDSGVIELQRQQSAPIIGDQWQTSDISKENNPQKFPTEEPPEYDEWQSERNEVIRQIENADADKVIIIASESEASNSSMVGEDEDIWQEEANRSLEEERSLQESNKIAADSQMDPEDSTFADLFQPEPLPMRGKIPSPWRKLRGNELIYSDEMDNEDSYLAAKTKENSESSANKCSNYSPVSSEMGNRANEEYQNHDNGNPEHSNTTGLPKTPNNLRRRFGDHHVVNISDLFQEAEPLQSSPLKKESEYFGNILYNAPLLSPSKHKKYLESSEGDWSDSVTEPTVMDVTQGQAEPSQENNSLQTFSSPSNADHSEIGQLEPEISSSSTPNRKSLVVEGSYDNASFIVRNDSSFYKAPSREAFETSQLQESQEKGLFTRLRSYLWPSTLQPRPTTTPKTWSTSQFVLLDRIWRCSPLIPPPVPPPSRTSKKGKAQKPDLLASARNRAARAAADPYPYPSESAMEPLRPRIAELIGSVQSKFCYTIEMQEAHLRLVQLFIDEAAGNGLETRDGLFVDERDSDVGGERTVVEPGRGYWVKENWEGDGGEEFVLGRLFALIAAEEWRRSDAGLVGTVLECT